MAIRITTTHFWSKLFVPITWISRIIAIVIVISLLSTVIPDDGYWGVLYIIAFFATIILHALTLEQWYHIVQTYLYIKINIGTEISFNEARYFLLLFAPTEMGIWYPMTGIKELPKNYRRQVLFESARKIYAEHGYQFGLHTAEYQYVNKEETVVKKKFHLEEESYLPLGFDNLVVMLCKMAKGDGLITQEEIDVIDNFFINVLKLTPNERKRAIEIFREAKETGTPFEVYVREFNRQHRNNKDLLEAVVDMLASVAFADGVLSAEEEILLNQAITIFEVEATQYKKYKSAYSEENTSQKVEGKEEHYAKILGLQNDITQDKVKTAYKKLALQYHPDKVSHLGAKIREVAEAEMKKINEAYEYFQEKYS